MHRSTLTGPALVALGALFVASWMGTAGADKKGGYVETDLVVGGPLMELGREAGRSPGAVSDKI